MRTIAHARRRRRPAHTLPELALVLALVGLLAAIASVRIARALDRATARAAATELAQLLAETREAAVARGAVAVLHLDASRGVVVLRAGPDTLRQRPLAALHRVAIASTRDSVAYGPLGLGWGVANARFIVARGAAAETVTVSRLGRVRSRE